MTKSLAETINAHTERAVRDAFLEGSLHGIEIGRRILNDQQVSKEESKIETEAAIQKIFAKFKLSEEETPHEE